MAHALQRCPNGVTNDAPNETRLRFNAHGLRVRGPVVYRAGERGLTLIELLLVVAIVGILSLIAIFGYRRVMQSAKMTEATHMVSAIKIAQEAYKSETGSYLNASSALTVNGTNIGACFPPGTGAQFAAATGTTKYSWEGWTSGATAGNFATLGVKSDGPVVFCYSTIAGAAGVAPSAVGPSNFTVNGTAYTWATGGRLSAGPWYIVGAQADLDVPGNNSYSSVVGSSWQSDIVIDNEGE